METHPDLEEGILPNPPGIPCQHMEESSCVVRFGPQLRLILQFLHQGHGQVVLPSHKGSHDSFGIWEIFSHVQHHECHSLPSHLDCFLHKKINSCAENQKTSTIQSPHQCTVPLLKTRGPFHAKFMQQFFAISATNKIKSL